MILKYNFVTGRKKRLAPPPPPSTSLNIPSKTPDVVEKNASPVVASAPLEMQGKNENVLQYAGNVEPYFTAKSFENLIDDDPTKAVDDQSNMFNRNCIESKRIEVQLYDSNNKLYTSQPVESPISCINRSTASAVISGPSFQSNQSKLINYIYENLFESNSDDINVNNSISSNLYLPAVDYTSLSNNNIINPIHTIGENNKNYNDNPALPLKQVKVEAKKLSIFKSTPYSNVNNLDENQAFYITDLNKLVDCREGEFV